MLTRLRLQNFKSWADTQDIPLKPITAFFGPNSSGKTSLLQALLLLKQTADSSDRGLVFHFGNKNTPVELGDFESVVHKHDTDKALEISLDWKLPSSLKITDTNTNQSIVESKDIGFTVATHAAAEKLRKPLLVDEMSYLVGNSKFGMRPKGNKYELFSSGANGEGFEFTRSRGRPWDIPSPDKCYGFPDAVRAYFQNAGFLADLQLALEERLENLYYLGPLRAYPERRYSWSGAQPIDMGQTGESVVDAILASRERGEKIGRGRGKPRLTVEQYVAHWLKELGLIHDFRIEPLAQDSPVFEVRIRKSRNSSEVLITDVGFGVSQILPVLVLCLYAPPGSTVILEQPEIHLHPAVQAGLADILIETWKNKNRRVQILIESHSEHLLRRLQRRIAESHMDITDNDVRLFFCEMSSGRSRITALDLDMFGNINNWPQDFFGNQFGEIAATSRAALDKHLVAS
ncbi:MAG: DUF3696 domain-containing protein [Chloroflexi bacterium]|nr:DUF3696 domain-containing protein [Chloroflexota bacterium]